MTRTLSSPFARAAAATAAAAVFFAMTIPTGASAAAKKRSHRPEPTAAPRPPDPNRVTIPTSDGISLAGTWRPIPGVPKAPAVLLIHDFSRERREWDVLAHDFLVHGLATLAIDLRGHGESTRKQGGETVRPSPRFLRDPRSFPRDAKAALDWLRERSPAVGAIGLSTGANLAVLATANGWADAAVAISANVANLSKLAGPLPYQARKTLVLASVQDPGREASAKELDADGESPKKLILFPGAAHNLYLLAENLEARREALEWLSARLGAVSPMTLSPGPGGGVFLSPLVGPGTISPSPTPTPTAPVPVPGKAVPGPR
jgi:pimeloyl-ACP methyl ester carboxylesterase